MFYSLTAQWVQRVELSKTTSSIKVKAHNGIADVERTDKLASEALCSSQKGTGSKALLVCTGLTTDMLCRQQHTRID